MTVVADVVAAETEFNRFLTLLSGVPSQRMAMWNSVDYRKSSDVFFPGIRVDAHDRIVFVLNNRAMMAAVLNRADQKFYLRFYWLAFEYTPGYISPGLSYDEAAAVMAEFVELPVINFKKTKAATLNFRQIVGKCDDNMFGKNNVTHNKVMERIFQVDDWLGHLEEMAP
jgi:hypothetical protein